MSLNLIHKLNIETEEEFNIIQEQLKSKIDLTNHFDNIRLCAGVDLAYWQKENNQYAVCSIVVLDYNTHNIVEKAFSYGVVNVPYVAGYLAFRELPLVIKASEKLKTNPDIFMFDGNGYLHFNHMGIATHASFFFNKPTIGVAKSYFKIKDTNYSEPSDTKGSFSDIVIDNEIYGRALRTKDNVKPIFVSCGNYIDLDTSTEIVINLVDSQSKLPITTRLADLETHSLRKILSQQ